MVEKLTSFAEQRAEEALKLPPFDKLNLLGVKRELDNILQLIGRNQIFDQYTKHDISHIDAMLTMLDWLIPEGTKRVMSPADWLMLVLAIYFHDVGLLVTQNEYERRADSGFEKFRDTVLFAGDDGKDYQHKVQALDPEKAERFLYQEFVRHQHAERIRSWLTGKAPERLGISGKTMREIDRLLAPLDDQFRRDLALVSESHHLADLNDFKKYKTSQPYGDSDEATVNLQFSAILLRTTDLLHVTKDRTPSVTFRLINPGDPISQVEWAKQKAVTRVRDQLGKDRDGNPDADAPRDTIEVHAFFTNPDGFFGLTSYLVYAAAQLRQSYDWVEEAKKTTAAPHRFPWQYMDDSNIEAKGFLRDKYEFTIDQAKILDLLTGHTLYNDSSVILRELVQNSLDAVRLQHVVDRGQDPHAQIGSVSIHWNSAERVLSVRDTGTGMTQRVIERNFLKIGASRYQDEDFKKEFPDFSPISRFGIGVLSAFMVADSVEVYTCHPDNHDARYLTLRNVHGRYLIRLLNKDDHPMAKQLVPHGTLVRLELRRSASTPDFVEAARKWIVVPGCDVRMKIDDQDPISVGFSSVGEALRARLEKAGYAVASAKERDDSPAIRVIERQLEGVCMAYAVRWSDFFNEWSFVRPRSEDEVHLCGTSLEGIQVEPWSPGFSNDSPVIAMVNAVGPRAPQTNVARSGLDLAPKRELMLEAISKGYCEHVREEIAQFCDERGFSLTWAAQEASYLLSPLIERSAHSEPELFHRALAALPLLIVEQYEERKLASLQDIDSLDCFWTLDGPFFRTAEWVLREVPRGGSLIKLMRALGARALIETSELVLCGHQGAGALADRVWQRREVDRVIVDEPERRVALRWARQAKTPRWWDPHADGDVRPDDAFRDRMIHERRRFRPPSEVSVALGDVQLDCAPAVAGVVVDRRAYLFGSSNLGRFLRDARESVRRAPRTQDERLLWLLGFTAADVCVTREPLDEAELAKWVSKALGQDAPLPSWYDRAGFRHVLNNELARIYNTSAYTRFTIG